MPRGHRSAAGEFTLLARKLKMSACWMLLILVGCRLSRATQTDSQCSSRWKTICIHPGQNVSVPCPKLPHTEGKFFLFYNKEDEEEEKEIYNHTYNSPGVELHENRPNETASFMLIGVNANRSGLYSCEGRFTYPPPFIKQTDLKILVHVKGHQCKPECRRPPPVVLDQKCGFPWIWVILLIIASVYGLIISIIAIIVWIKLRGADSQSDYMNTKPKAPRERKKKRGVQNPIPRYF